MSPFPDHRDYCIPMSRGGGGVISPFDGGGGGWPEKIYRGVRELLFIPKKGGGGVREPE